MKARTFVPSLLFLGLFACSSPEASSEVENQDAEAVEVAELEKYGDERITPDGAIDASELMAALSGKDSVEIKVKGTINACCQKKGCWMDMELADGENMTVRFKDYGFFVPMNSAGRAAIIEGVARLDTQSVDWLRHKAEDAGKSAEEIAAITEPEIKVSFLASGVILE